MSSKSTFYDCNLQAYVLNVFGVVGYIGNININELKINAEEVCV